tara:strand:- start:369 stop:560 length:192 start_codon:yes stop_codon:yes gene_type:complete
MKERRDIVNTWTQDELEASIKTLETQLEDAKVVVYNVQGALMYVKGLIAQKEEQKNEKNNATS